MLQPSGGSPELSGAAAPVDTRRAREERSREEELKSYLEEKRLAKQVRPSVLPCVVASLG